MERETSAVPAYSRPLAGIDWHRWAALPVVLLIVAVAIVYTRLGKPSLAVFWVFGLAFGFVLQRSRFCFASAFRDLYLLQDGRVIKGIIIGLAVATIGFSLVMYKLQPDLAAGKLPGHANVYPLGPHTLLAGVLFGLGMVLGGGCATGTLYRIGEGYVASFVAFLGMLIGMFLLALQWGWWWPKVISIKPKVWLPHKLGWSGGILVTFIVLLLFYLLVLWWESRGGPKVSVVAEEPPLHSWKDRVRALGHTVFVKAWPATLGGLLLGTLNVFEYIYSQPWGVTTEMSRWAGWLVRLLGYPVEVLLYYGGKPAGYELLKNIPWYSGGALLDWGIIAGSLLAALLAREFKLRTPPNRARYAQALVGGILMGYGARLAMGCNIGSFFSAIPSLALNGWVFAVGLAIGSYFGVLAIKRLA
ncbi:MAG: YeeE/YedE family protein [candidate division NC10 bacterium]|nr:YeeE/YedE family protein [candidate division NC10 bacterium]